MWARLRQARSPVSKCCVYLIQTGKPRYRRGRLFSVSEGQNRRGIDGRVPGLFKSDECEPIPLTSLGFMRDKLSLCQRGKD